MFKTNEIAFHLHWTLYLTRIMRETKSWKNFPLERAFFIPFVQLAKFLKEPKKEEKERRKEKEKEKREKEARNVWVFYFLFFYFLFYFILFYFFLF